MSRLSRAIAAVATTRTSRSPRRSDPDQAVRDDPPAAEERVQPDREEQLAREGQRGVDELRGRQVRDEGDERPVRRAG